MGNPVYAIDEFPDDDLPWRVEWITVRERAIARVRGRANSRLWRLLAARIMADHKERLDALLVVPGNARQSPMDRLRSGPVLQSVPELARAIKRLDEVRVHPGA
jgi:hypothetical protein